MKKIKLILGVVLSMPLTLSIVLSPAFALAVAPTTNTNAATPSTETSATRLAHNKEKYKLSLTAAEQNSVKSKCKAAQVISKALLSSADKSNTARGTEYGAIETDLNGLVKDLKALKVSTTALEADIAKFTVMIKDYHTDYTAYKTTLSDLNEIDCGTDPVGFKSNLLAAREARKTVATQTVAIRTYINETLKKDLKDIKDGKQTETKAKTDSDTTTTKTNKTTTGGQ